MLLWCLAVLPLAAQNGSLSMTFDNENLSSALRRLEKESDYKISFAYNDVGTYKVSGTRRNASVEQLLQWLLDGKPLTYTVRGRMVDIRRQPVTRQATHQQPASRDIAGIVTDETGEPLPGATVPR